MRFLEYCTLNNLHGLSQIHIQHRKRSGWVRHLQIQLRVSLLNPDVPAAESAPEVADGGEALALREALGVFTGVLAVRVLVLFLVVVLLEGGSCGARAASGSDRGCFLRRPSAPPLPAKAIVPIRSTSRECWL